jgi:hypothetical protein
MKNKEKDTGGCFSGLFSPADVSGGSPQKPVIMIITIIMFITFIYGLPGNNINYKFRRRY